MKKFFVLLMICSLVFSLCSCSESTKINLEKDAKGYYKQLKKIETITSLDNVVCVASKRWDSELNEMVIRLGYLFIFNSADNKFAFFEDGNYKGDGENGGDETGVSKSFFNLQSLGAQIMYIEYLKDGTHLITLEDANNGSEGIILLDINKIK